MNHQQLEKKIETLESRLADRDRTIIGLQASDNVMLWTKEKARLLREHENIIKGLHDKIKQVNTASHQRIISQNAIKG